MLGDTRHVTAFERARGFSLDLFAFMAVASYAPISSPEIKHGVALKTNVFISDADGSFIR